MFPDHNAKWCEINRMCKQVEENMDVMNQLCQGFKFSVLADFLPPPSIGEGTSHGSRSNLDIGVGVIEPSIPPNERDVVSGGAKGFPDSGEEAYMFPLRPPKGFSERKAVLDPL